MGVRWVFKLILWAQNLIGWDSEPIKLKTFLSDSLESFQIKNVPSSIRNITLIIYDGLDATNPSPIPIQFSQPIRNELEGSNEVKRLHITVWELVKSVSDVGKFTVTLKSDLIQIKIEEVNKIGNYYFRNLRFYNIYFLSNNVWYIQNHFYNQMVIPNFFSKKNFD